MTIFRFIPTLDDHPCPGTQAGARSAACADRRGSAIAADSLGHEGVPITTGRRGEDSWIVGASLNAAPVDQIRQPRAATR